MELISEIHQFLANHLNKYENCRTSRADYIFSTAINEFIKIMPQKAQNEIIIEVKIAKYFSIIIDSVSDTSYVDPINLSYSACESQKCVVEKFLTFTPTQSHRVEHLFETISA